MATVPAEVHGPSDAELIESVRKGTVAAYGSLYERHVGAAYNLARQLTRNQAEADDLVSEAFAKVLDTLRAGRGPDSAFRAYLLTALRHTAYDKTRRDKRVELSDDVTTVSGADTAVPFSDTAVAGLERTLAARAFSRLPERWQAVLWHTEVEGQTPAEVAPILGLTPNGVSALAYRAREGLRQAYLQVHLAESTSERCRATAERLGAWTRGGLSKRETAQVESHLDECDRCRALAAELADVNSGMRVFIAPLVLGVGALGYLATTAKAGSAVIAGAAATTAAGTAAGAGGAASSLPRQFVGVGASVAAVAAAVALALTAAQPPDLPTAQQVPQTSTQQPAPPNNPPAPTPLPPAPPPQNSPTTPAPPSPAPPSPAPPSPAPPSPTSPSAPAPVPPPQPGPPNLTVPSPPPITLVPGSGPTVLPLSVTNNGESVSQPVSASLNLPPGVSAVGADRLAGPGPLRLNGARQPSSITCPGGTGTVTCGSEQGLQPGASVTLLFRIVAAADSKGGTITGTISAGTSVSVKISVNVEVQPPPKKDGVSVYAFQDWLGLPAPGRFHYAALQAVAKNTGESTKQVTVTFDQPAKLLSAWPAASCTSNGATTSCVTSEPLKPGDRFYLRVKLTKQIGDDEADRYHHPPFWQYSKVLVTASLGTASASTTVKLPWWSWPVPPDSKPTTTKPPVTTTPPKVTTTKPSGKPTTTTTLPAKETPKPGTTTPKTTAPKTTAPATTTRPRSEERPPDDYCSRLGPVERLLAVLTGRCPPR
nr:sigma-70 family RNA polymerase sigma factor [Kibdelosporangium sp. MJ126-NF4]CEL22120.1 sigma-70 region 2 domain protein [Kibdelosporangium sp. MJ126-NF4]CTQ92901.1 sigma-70 region 2 domain protein [Kibdelosporangium sp. MJ126-NF4]